VDAEKVEPISHVLNLHLSDAQGTLTLSQRALNFVTSSPGVSVVLNGMKREEYVEDAMQIMEMPDFPQPLALIESVRRET
jgi:aryl-alcohol dehydrogenase-like predicted oxidoreductase